MRGFPKDFWGKLAKNGSDVEWHPLIDHCADVAAVCEALLRRTLIRGRLAALGEREDLGEGEIQRLAALTALHDAGKFNHGFQCKADPSSKNTAGHVEPILSVLGHTDSFEHGRLVASIPLREIQEWTSDSSGLELLCAAIAHHGRPVEVGGGSGPRHQIWQVEWDGRDPFEGIARLSRKVREWFPAAFSPGAQPLPSQARFQHAFCGLVTLADWIGSDRFVFRFSEEGDRERIDFARERASSVLRRIGLDVAGARAAFRAKPREFEEIFGFVPNHIQRCMVELATAPGGDLAILESETGSGKTEAAVTRFFTLFNAGLVDGMYFALPTRTAAVQMHHRIKQAVKRAFLDEATRPPVILAVPGYLSFEDNQAEDLLASPYSLWPDDEAARWRFRHWASEHPKRYLAGAISVGTIDQALLSALAASHSHLRATSLLRQFLVVDEVHASDSYMTSILREVLRFHLAAGGYALLLSATLGSRAMVRLATATGLRVPRPPSFDEAVCVPYPVLTIVGEADVPMARRELRNESPSRAVALEVAPVADDFAATARLALDAVSQGARILIVRNTVRDCVATQLQLERLAVLLGLKAGLFAINGVPAPHHARFARVDRELLDCELESRFGKHSSAPVVLAATQTVQQSLDIDADLMLTDLCPIDVMLQRVGRLHRHQRDRPKPFRAARVIVVTPASRDLTALIERDGSAWGEHGIGTVYDDLRILEATWRALEAQQVLQIPEMNRRLVESATHPEVLNALEAELGERWRTHARRCNGVAIAEQALARLNLVNRDEPFIDCRFPSSLETRIRTRLGEDDRLIEFFPALPGPLGAPIDRLTIPGWLVQRAPADATVEEVTVHENRIGFKFAARAFAYDRLGLRPAEPSSNPEEDLADA